MGSKKAIVWPVIISIFIHMTLLAVTGMIDLRDNVKPVEIFSVSIKEPETSPAPKKEEIKKKETKSVRNQNEKGVGISDNDWREDTVDLGSLDIKYVTYLAKIKKKILQIWQYPPKAYENNEEGKVIVKMSIDADGRLAGVSLISSSGYAELDEGALSVVQAAAPFEPLPVKYDLSRLNIVASFHYKITD
ncbi:MAG: energy transducer TonB [Parcubacteria group bacterium]|nr:MAG: energy transducer TonB [Parcubacteria group bacterium]